MLRTRGTWRVYRRDSFSNGQLAGWNAAGISATGTLSKYFLPSTWSMSGETWRRQAAMLDDGK
ncbi:hypothetical protein F1880_001285 [Penicillium rolfsii]|nr:hypothetical protein F1880_001285 [Penicillium rolfsii]